MKYLTILLLVLAGCGNSHNYLLRITDTITQKQGYINAKGDTVIPLGKYGICFTDTFKTYAIVNKWGQGFVGIDKKENVLFHIYRFDNGPDDPSDGVFRIVENGKIGYADTVGAIIIKPQFGCAYSFENGRAKVALTCTRKMYGEHGSWESDNWFYIDKSGSRLKK